MAIHRKNKKEELLTAAVRLVATGGAEAATVRAIAREAGVTDAAVYRHYDSKDDLCWRAYNRIVDEMIREKRDLVHSDAPLRERLREWVRLSYAYYDRNPAAVVFLLAMPLVAYKSGHSKVIGQGELFLEMIERALDAGEIRPISPEVALSHFVGILLNVPRLISEGTLPGPASDYVDEVAMAAWLVLRAEPT
jgi:AcrR family transcriptional regulator